VIGRNAVSPVVAHSSLVPTHILALDCGNSPPTEAANEGCSMVCLFSAMYDAQLADIFRLVVVILNTFAEVETGYVTKCSVTNAHFYVFGS
jgi:hypothetical protein